MPSEKPRIGVSACLLGRSVRYDGGHSEDAFITSVLSSAFELLPVCPEAESGLPAPREPMRLEGDPGDPRLMAIETRRDLSARLKAFAAARVEGLAKEHLAGFIFKSKSPSCGLRQVKVFDESGLFRPVGVGIFARAFLERFPLLPALDEMGLADPVARAAFLERLFKKTG